MDPLASQPTNPNTNQPPAPATPPQQPLPSTTPQAVEPARPQPVTTPTAPIDRPVESWPPAGTPAAQEASMPQPAAPSMGNQPIAPAEASSSSPNLGSNPNTNQSSPPPITQPLPSTPPQAMEGFVSPAAKEIKDQVNANQPAQETADQSPMSDQQADKLFQEEPATKARKKHARLKKVLLIFVSLIIVAALAAGAYIYLYGNKVAQSYVNTSTSSAYKEAFTQIDAALSKQPVDSAELEAGLNKLQTTTQNTKIIVVLPLGELNPNYKKAKQLSSLEASYKAKAEQYQTKYAANKDFIKALADSLYVVASLDDLKTIDLTTTTAEKMTTDLGNLLKDCTAASKALKDAAKPEELAASSESLSSGLARICSESAESIEDGALVLLAGKSGLLNAADQLKMRSYLDLYGTTSSVVASKTVDPNADLAALTAYQQAVLADTQQLLQESQSLTN